MNAVALIARWCLVGLLHACSATRVDLRKYHLAQLEKQGGTSSERRVYIDLGANWMNTARLYQDLKLDGREKQTPWETYLFEASPYIQPYCDKFAAWLNGKGPKPPVTVPPSGSSGHLQSFAGRFGCPKLPLPTMRSCMWRKFQEPLSKLHIDPELTNLNVAKARLSEASTPVTAGQKDRFTFVPAAAGDHDGTLDLAHLTPEEMIRGGALSNATVQGKKDQVPMVDVMAWIQRSFSQDDFIVLKVDIEGAEFPLIQRMLSLKAGSLVDIMYLECHTHGNTTHQQCSNLLASVRAAGVVLRPTVPGMDHYSTPDVYYPENP